MKSPQASTGPSAPILVITNERDFAADLVIDRVQRAGAWVERWNTETPREIVWTPSEPPSSSSASAVWLRQHLPDPACTNTVAEVDDFLVAREQWRAWLTDLAETDTRWMNPLWAARRAENKLVQLRTATHLGFDVPPTIVTNSKSVALGHQLQTGPCVVKSVAAAYFPFSTSAFMFTTPLAEALELSEADWAGAPVVVQKTVTPRTDIRVFVVGSHASGAAATVDGPDWRIHSGETTWTRWDPPADLIGRCRAYNKALGLTYSAFDFAYDGATAWFLECNQAGEFAFIDRPLNLGVADAIAAWLIGADR